MGAHSWDHGVASSSQDDRIQALDGDQADKQQSGLCALVQFSLFAEWLGRIALEAATREEGAQESQPIYKITDS